MENLSNIIEAILFVSGDGVAFSDIAEKLEVDIADVKEAVQQLQQAKRESNAGVQVAIFNDKAQLRSNEEFVDQIAVVLNPIRERALTRTVLEVLAIIAYNQPITRMEIESMRESKNCDYAVNALLENNLIEVVGRKDTVGKPLEFGTTDNFLKKFGLQNIGELPEYEELLERIQVIKDQYSKEDSSLFNFNNIPDQLENGDIGIEVTKEEEVEEIDNLIEPENEEKFLEELSKLEYDTDFDSDDVDFV